MSVQSFPPVADERSRLLVLGSMPGTASLKVQQYYGNPRNHLWAILYGLFADGPPDSDYESRIAFARSHGIALWDTIAQCEREGSLDSDIRDVVPNDIPGLLRKYPLIGTIACNGAKSYSELLKHFGKTTEIASRRVLKLPSTSPIPTPKYRGLEERLEAWSIIKEAVT